MRFNILLLIILCPFFFDFLKTFILSTLGFVVRQWRDRSDRPYSGSYTRVGSHRKSLGDISDTVYGGSYSQSNIGITSMGGRGRKYQPRENMKNDSKSASTSSTSNRLFNSNVNVNSAHSTKENRSSKGKNQSEIRKKNDDNSRNICTVLDFSDKNAFKFTTPINDNKNSNREYQESYSSSNPLNSQQEDDKMKKLNNSNTSTVDTNSERDIQKTDNLSQNRNQMMTKTKSNSELFLPSNNTGNDSNENKIDNINLKYFLNSMLKEEESPVKYESLRDAFKIR